MTTYSFHMMKNNTIVLLIPLFSLLIACSSRSDLESPLKKTHDEFYISQDEALNIALTVTGSISISPITRSENDIDNIFSFEDYQGIPAIYVFNFSEGGFYIISGDKRVEPILAYSDAGHFVNKTSDYPYGLQQWLDEIISDINYARSTNAEQSKEIRGKWAKFDVVSLTRSVPIEEGGVYEIDTTVGPLIFDSWHQYSPYNDALDSAAHSYYNIKPLVGCVPLAIARIMRYNSYPTNFQWSQMPNNEPQTSTTKAFIKDVYDNVEDYCDDHSLSFQHLQQGSYWGSFVDPTFPIGTFMKTIYGYHHASDMSYNSSNSTHVSTLTNEILNNMRPAILRGTSSQGGHAWICDGCHYIIEIGYDSDFNEIGLVSHYFHYLWGEPYNDDDGWYSRHDMSHNSFNFNSNVRLTYNIIP